MKRKINHRKKHMLEGKVPSILVKNGPNSLTKREELIFAYLIPCSDKPIVVKVTIFESNLLETGKGFRDRRMRYDQSFLYHSQEHTRREYDELVGDLLKI
jgi:hypothetical protein